MLSFGFTLSALTMYGLVHLLGSGVFGGMGHTGAKSAAALVMLGCLVIDSGLFGLSTPMWRRQTPRQHFYRFGPVRGALLWGLDTGLVVTTFRVTSLTWAALGVTLFGLVPWWVGLAYALGFTVPAFAMVALVPPSKDPVEIPEPIWLMDWLMEREKPIRRVALAVLTAALAGVAISVFQG
ncbi:hypothetical protein [Nonomuraea sp. SYSU D8015]|uniref:hypothetical protein n=1 Tax=Nonomuraea sp. SYSU D8015 TaxID=2593644 RepID=UPI0016616C30|nr:hypothetical protein [Nonomuraea sp. SYSU D8015]